MSIMESRLRKLFAVIFLVAIALITVTSLPVKAAPSVSNIVVTEDIYTMNVDFRLTTNGDFHTVVYEEDNVILTAFSVAASNQDRNRDWDKDVAMKGLHWAIRLTDDDGVTWVNGTYEKGPELITFQGITTTNLSIAFHVLATLECNLTAYRDGTQVYEGSIGSNFATIEFVRNGTVGTHTYNISFIQTRFESSEFTWQLDHEDILAEKLVIPTETITITTTVTVTVTETVTVTVQETITETIVIDDSSIMNMGVGMAAGAGLGVAVVVVLFIMRERRN
jgi:hypothetical protein